MARPKGYWSDKVGAVGGADLSDSSDDDDDVRDAVVRKTETGVTSGGATWKIGYTIFGVPYLDANIRTTSNAAGLSDWAELIEKVPPACPALNALFDKERAEALQTLEKPKPPPKPTIGSQIMIPWDEGKEMFLINDKGERVKNNRTDLKRGEKSQCYGKSKEPQPSCSKYSSPKNTASPKKVLVMGDQGSSSPRGHERAAGGTAKHRPDEEVTKSPGSEAMRRRTSSPQPVMTGVNPMLIDHVMESVLGHLPTATLKACRLLCRQWNIAATKILVDKRPSLIVRTNPHNEEEMEAMQKSLAKDPQLGLECLSVVGFKMITNETPLGVFMKKVGPKLSVLKLLACKVSPGLLREILRRRAPYLEVLHMQSVGFEMACFDRMNLSWAIILDGLRLEHMKEFKVVDEFEADYDGVTLYKPFQFHESPTISMFRLFTAFPNLERLIVKGELGFVGKGEEMNFELYKNNKDYERCNWKNTLKEFVFHALDSDGKGLNPSVFKALQSIGTNNLSKIDITPFVNEKRKGFRPIMDSIYDFLTDKNVKSTLKELRISVYTEHCHPSDIQLMPLRLPSLERLCMSSDMIICLRTLPIQESFTKLEIEDHHSGGGRLKRLLAQEKKYDRFGTEIRGPFVANCFITSLRLRTLGVKEIVDFGKYCPNLLELELNFIFYDKKYIFIPDEDKLDYRTLSKAFPKLETLKVRCPINYKSTLSPVDEDIIGETGICSMKNLRVVDMHPADKLTDVAVMQGFSNLQNLEFLNLSRSQISPRLLQWLGRHPEKLPKLKTLKLEACRHIKEEHCVMLSSARLNLNIIYSAIDNEVCWCFRHDQERQHNKETCNCEDLSFVHKRPANYMNVSVGTAGAKPVGAGFW